MWTLSLKNAMQGMAQGNDVLIYNYYAEIHAEKAVLCFEELRFILFSNLTASVFV